jgi:hypothetical protein
VMRIPQVDDTGWLQQVSRVLTSVAKADALRNTPEASRLVHSTAVPNHRCQVADLSVQDSHRDETMSKVSLTRGDYCCCTPKCKTWGNQPSRMCPTAPTL